jgi:hypothetical protein
MKNTIEKQAADPGMYDVEQDNLLELSVDITDPVYVRLYNEFEEDCISL